MVTKCLFNIIFFLSWTSIVYTQIHYVSIGANGAGTSWSDASGNLSEILAIAEAGDQVWLAAGTYYPTQCSPCTDTDRDISFEIPDSVEVYGGFAGTEVNLNQRDWESNVTLLSGDIDQDGLIINNARTVVLFSRVSAATVLDGFSIIEGNAIKVGGSTSGKENSGAAVFNQGELSNSMSHPVLRNCIFENNTASGYGGAVYSTGGFTGNASPVFENCIFQNNHSELGGGAFFNYASFSGVTRPEFTSCVFLNNSSTLNGGGAVYNQGAETGDCNPLFVDCVFDGNTTTDYGGAVHSHGREGQSNSIFQHCTFRNNEANFGGGVSNNGTSHGVSNATFIDCLFESNHVTGDGGGVFNWGSEGESNATFMDCIFRNNNSDFAGAGMFNNGIDGYCIASITNCRFLDNTSTTYGGAIYNNGKRGDASATITNCLFKGNAGNSAGAVYNLGSEHGNGSPKITNCTFFGNTANVGGAVYNNASDSTGTSNPVITNCIFWKNKANFGNVFRNILSTPLIQHSVVDELNCEDMNSGLGSAVSCGEGVLFNIYPEFEDTLAGDFRLKSDSPLLDIGDNSTIDTTGIDFDLDHQNRIFNDVVDLGAFEYFDDYLPPVITNTPQSTSLCAGEMLSISIIATGAPPLNYQWFKDGISVAGATNAELVIATAELEDSGAYYCEVSSTMGDMVSSESAEILVEPILSPGVEIEASDLEICQGELITFNTIANNGGDDPITNWYLNGNLIFENMNSITVDNLNDEDEISVELLSSLNCAQPLNATDTARVTVSPLLEVSVEIAGPDSVVCIGEEAIFQATADNEGSSPQYLWFINGTELADQNEPLFTTTDLMHNDVITCMLTSSEECTIANSSLSNEITIAVDSCNFTNVRSLINNQQVQITPNPSKGDFSIKTIGLSGLYNIQILDVTGKSLLSQQITADNTNNQLTLPRSGVYFIKLFNKTSINVQRIVINKE